MEFKVASDRMVNALTLQEKTLAKQYAEAIFLEVESRTVRVISCHIHEPAANLKRRCIFVLQFSGLTSL